MNCSPKHNHAFVVVDYLVDGARTVAGLMDGKARLLGTSVVGSAGEARFVVGDGVRHLQTLEGCRRVYFDAVFGRAVEQKFGLPVSNDFDDVKVVGRLLEDERFHELERQCCPAPASANGAVGPPVVSPLSMAVERSLHRARQIWSAFAPGQLMGRLVAAQLQTVYRDIELPVVDATIHMIRNGIPVDLELLRGIEASHAVQVEIARCQLSEAAGREVNADSLPDVSALLFEQAGLPVLARNRDGSPATSDIVLRQLEPLHRAVGPLRAYRTAKPVLDAAHQLLSHYDAVTGCVHAELDPLGTVTGRFSCSKPALQALPPALMGVFRAPPGYGFIEADFSQIELRVLAQLSGDQAFVGAFQDPGTDIHRRTAAAVLAIPEEQVSIEDRQTVGKAVNFGIIYGETSQGLAHKLDILCSAAQSLIDAFYGCYPTVATWINFVQQQACTSGIVTTAYGRPRRLGDVRSRDPGRASHALRQAVNTVVQGTAADLNKFALVRLFRALPDDCRLLLTIHDSFLLAAPVHRLQEVVGVVRQILESPPPGFSVPIKASIRTGTTWAQCKEYS